MIETIAGAITGAILGALFTFIGTKLSYKKSEKQAKTIFLTTHKEFCPQTNSAKLSDWDDYEVLLNQIQEFVLSAGSADLVKHFLEYKSYLLSSSGKSGKSAILNDLNKIVSKIEKNG